MNVSLDDLERAWREAPSEATWTAYLTALETNVAEAPEDARRRLRFGVALQGHGDVGRAIPELVRAKASRELLPKAAFYLGLSFVKLKMAKLAVSELKAALQCTPIAEPTAKDIAYLLGRIHEAAGKKNEAVDYYRMLSDWPFDSPGGGTAGTPAPLRPGDPPRRPPEPPSTQMMPGL